MPRRAEGILGLGWLAALCLGAGGGCKESKNGPPPSAFSKIRTVATPAAMPGAQTRAAVERYRLSAGGRDLSVSLRRLDPSRAEATIVSKDTDAGCEIRFSGLFLTIPGADAETLENEAGEAVLAVQYLHESDSCWLEIQVGEGLMKLQSADCGKVERAGCRFSSDTLLTLEAGAP